MGYLGYLVAFYIFWDINDSLIALRDINEICLRVTDDKNPERKSQVLLFFSFICIQQIKTIPLSIQEQRTLQSLCLTEFRVITGGVKFCQTLTYT